VLRSATTLSALNSDNSFNDSANGFLTAGFAVGDQVRVQGFTGNAANNIFSATVTVLTAGKMTVGGADGNVIVDDAAGETVTITKWETRRASASEIAGLVAGGGVHIPVACSDETTALGTGNDKVTFHWPLSGTVTDIWCALTTPQASGSIFTVDVNNNGATMLSTKLTIDNTEETSLTAATARVLTNTTITKGQKGTIDIDQIGNGSAKGLKVYIVVAP